MKPLVFFLLMSGAVMGQECVSTADMAKDIAKNGGSVLSGASYRGAVSDTSIITIVQGALWLVAFKDGCYVNKFVLDAIVPEPEVVPQVVLSASRLATLDDARWQVSDAARVLRLVPVLPTLAGAREPVDAKV